MPPLDDLIVASVTHPDGIVVLSISGQIDVTTESTFETVTETVLAEEPTGMIIDLSAVDFLGSAGLRVLAVTQERLALFAVVANSPVIIKPIQLTGFDQILRLSPTVEGALAALRDRLKPTAIEPPVISLDDGDGTASDITSSVPEQ